MGVKVIRGPLKVGELMDALSGFRPDAEITFDAYGLADELYLAEGMSVEDVENHNCLMTLMTKEELDDGIELEVD